MIKVKAFGILAALAALPVFAEPSAGQRTGEGNETTTAKYGLRYSTLARAGTLAVRPTSEANDLSFTLSAETFDKAIVLEGAERPIVFVPSTVTVTEIAVAIPGTDAPGYVRLTPKDGEPVTFTPTGDAESVTLTDTDGSTAAATLRTYASAVGVTLAPGQACGFVFDDTEVGTAPRNFYTFDGAPHLRIEGSATITRHVLNISDGATHSFTELAGFSEPMDQADQVFVVEFSGAGGTLEMDGALQNAPLVVGSSVPSESAALAFGQEAFTVPLSLRDGEGGVGGVSLTFGEGEAFNPSALLLACDVTLKSPVNLPEGAWLATHDVPIPAGRTFRLELDQPVGSENNLPNLSFADATSRLELASDAASPEDNPLGIPSKYQTMLCTQSGTLVLDRNVSVENANEEGSSVLSGFVLSDSRVAYGIPVNRPLETHVILRAGHTYDFGFMFGFEDYGPEMGSAPIGKATLTVEGGTVAVNTINLTATDATLDIQGGTVTAESLDGIDDGTNTAITVAKGATLRLNGGLPAGAADTTATLDLTVAGTLQLNEDLAMTPALRRTLTLADGTIESTRYYPDVVYVTCGDGGTSDGEGLLDIVGGGALTGSLVVDAASGQGDLALGGDVTLETLRDYTGTVSGAGIIEALTGSLGEVILDDTWLTAAAGKRLGDVLTGWEVDGTAYAGASAFSGTIGFTAGTETAKKTLDFTDLDELTSLGMAFRVANHQHIIMRLDQYADAIIRWPDDPQGITLTLIESGAYGGELTLPHFPHVEGDEGSGVKFEFATFDPNAENGYTVRTDGYSHTHTEDGVNDTLTWDNPVFTGEGAWIDIEFNGDTRNTGWFTLGDYNGNPVTTDDQRNRYNGLLAGDEPYVVLEQTPTTTPSITAIHKADFVDSKHPAQAHGSLPLHYRPFVALSSLEYPEAWTVSLRLSAPNAAHTCILALGHNYTGTTAGIPQYEGDVYTLIFATGDTPNEICLWVVPGVGADTPKPDAPAFTVTLADATAAQHTFSVICDGKAMSLYVDGAWLGEQALPGEGARLTNGLQVGVQLGASSIPKALQAEDFAVAATEAVGGSIDFLRFYKGAMPEAAMVEVADRTPYVRENLRYVRYVPLRTMPEPDLADYVAPTETPAVETWIQEDAWLEQRWDGIKWTDERLVDQPAEGAECRILVAAGEHTLQVNVERQVEAKAADGSVTNAGRYFYSPNRTYASLVVRGQDAATSPATLRLVPYGVTKPESGDTMNARPWETQLLESDWFKVPEKSSPGNRTGFRYGTLRFTGGANDPINDEGRIPNFYGAGYLLSGGATSASGEGTVIEEGEIVQDGGVQYGGGTYYYRYRQEVKVRYATTGAIPMVGIYDAGVCYLSRHANTVLAASADQIQTVEREWRQPLVYENGTYTANGERSIHRTTLLPTSDDTTVGAQLNTLEMVAGLSLTRGVMDEVVRWQLTGPVVVQGTTEAGRDYVLGHAGLPKDQASEDVWVPFFGADSTWKFYDDTRVEGGAENADGAKAGLFARGVQTPGRLYLDFTVGVGTGDTPGTAEDKAKPSTGNFSEQAWYRYGYEANQTTSTLSGMRPERAKPKDFDQAVAFQIRLSEKTGDVTLTLDKVPTARVQTFHVEEEAGAQKALTLKLERAEGVEALKIWKSVVAAARLDVSNNNTGVATATSGEGNALNLRPADGIRTPVQRGNATHGHGAFIVGATEVDWDFGAVSSVPRLEVIPGAELTFTVGQDFRRQDLGGITLVAQGKAASTFPEEGSDAGPTADDLDSAAWIHHRSAEPFLGQDVELGEGAIFGFHADAAASEADTQNEGVVLAGELRLTGNATLRADFESASGGAGAARLPHFVAAGGIRAMAPGLTLIVDAPTHQSADGQGGTGDWHCHTATLTGEEDFGLWKTGPGTVTFYATTPPSVTGKVTVEEGTLAVTAAADTPVGAKGLHVKKDATLADSGRMSGTARRLAIVPAGQTLSGGGTVAGPLGLQPGATYLAKKDEALTVTGGLTVGAAGEGSDATHVNVSLPANYVGDTPYLVANREERDVRRRLLPRKEAARWDAIAWLEGGSTYYAAREPAMPEPAAGDLGGNETVNAWHDGFEAILVNQYQSLGHAYVGATQGRTRAGSAHLSASEINEALYAFSGISAFAPSGGAATGGRTYIDAHNFFVAYEFGVSGMTFATIEGKEYAVVEVKVRNALAESFDEDVAAAAAEGAAAFRTNTKITFKAMKDGQALDLPEDVMVTEVANLAGDEGRSASGDTRYFALPYEALKKFFGEAPILLRPCAENNVELP